MRHRHESNVGAIWRKAHRSDDVIDVSHQLLGREYDLTGRSRRRGSRFKMDAIHRHVPAMGRGLAFFQWTDNLPVRPGLQDGYDKTDTPALGKGPGRGHHSVVGDAPLDRSSQPLESPPLAG